MIRWLLLALLLLPTLAYAQNPVGTCDQYFSTLQAGQACFSVGTASSFFPFSGDVIADYANTPQCSPTNSSKCGHMKVQGLNGVLFLGTLGNNQSWCYSVAQGALVPCNPSALPAGTNGQFLGFDNTNSPAAFTLTGDISVDGSYNVTVTGIAGIQTNGVLSNGETWCFDSGSGKLKPCLAGGQMPTTTVAALTTPCTPGSAFFATDALSFADGVNPSSPVQGGGTNGAAIICKNDTNWYIFP